MTRSPLLLLGVGLLALGCKGSPTSGGDTTTATPSANGHLATLKVAAASDLTFAFKEIGKAFEEENGGKVSFSFGASGLLAKQIAEGAPFDVFAAANVAYVDSVVKSGACFGDTKAMYARGKIVIFTAKGEAPQTLAKLTDAKYVKIAIANPDHAPYGRAAKQALERAGLWDALKPKIVYGENIQQTMTFAQTGNADVAIVAMSLALESKGASYAPIDDDQHDPIDQALVVCKGEARAAEDSPNHAPTSTAEKFVAYVNSPEGRTVMRRHGLLLPGEKLADSR